MTVIEDGKSEDSSTTSSLAALQDTLPSALPSLQYVIAPLVLVAPPPPPSPPPPAVPLSPPGSPPPPPPPPPSPPSPSTTAVTTIQSTADASRPTTPVPWVRHRRLRGVQRMGHAHVHRQLELHGLLRRGVRHGAAGRVRHVRRRQLVARQHVQAQRLRWALRPFFPACNPHTYTYTCPRATPCAQPAPFRTPGLPEEQWAMELMISAALFPSLLLCLCCLWCQMRSQSEGHPKDRRVSDGTWAATEGQRRGDGLLPTSSPATRSTRSMSGTRMASRGSGGKARGKRPPPRPSSRRVGARRQTRGQSPRRRPRSIPAARPFKSRERRIGCRHCRPRMVGSWRGLG